MTTLMQGFPPAEADRATLANWRTGPYCAWAFHHVRELVPSAEIENDPDDVWRLEPGRIDLSGVDLDGAMDATSTDAVAIIHEGRLAHEVYRNGMTARAPHILMSVSKSMLGLVAGSAMERGEIGEDALATDYVPELAETAYAGATIRNLLDMRAGVKFDEDYLATAGPIIDYRFAANWNPTPPGREAGDLRSFMNKMRDSDGPHGGRFHYVSPNTDLLGWILERATGLRYADLVAERLWRPLGAERPGYITVDRIGGARAAGGVCLTARDLARVGMMMADGGVRDGRRVIPESWIEDIGTAGDADAWRKGDFKDLFGDIDVAYRSKWYIRLGETPLIFGLGIHGQYLFIDRRRRLSIAWFSSGHEPIDEGKILKVMDTVEKIRKAAS